MPMSAPGHFKPIWVDEGIVMAIVMTYHPRLSHIPLIVPPVAVTRKAVPPPLSLQGNQHGVF